MDDIKTLNDKITNAKYDLSYSLRRKAGQFKSEIVFGVSSAGITLISGGCGEKAYEAISEGDVPKMLYYGALGITLLALSPFLYATARNCAQEQARYQSRISEDRNQIGGLEHQLSLLERENRERRSE